MGLVALFVPFTAVYYAILCLIYPDAVAEVIVEDLKEKFNNLFKDKTDINSFN